MTNIINGWIEKGRSASALGTYMHRQIELFLNGVEADTASIEMTQFKQFMVELDRARLIPFRTEWSIFDERRMIAGQVDAIFKHVDKEEYHMVDWKRCSKSLSPQAGRHFQKYGLPPCEQFIDNQWSHYAAQQNIYAVMLEQQYGIRLKSMHLLQLHPDQTGYKLIRIPAFPLIAKVMMNQVANPPVYTSGAGVQLLNTMLQRLSSKAVTEVILPVPEILLENGNCIFCGVANLHGDWGRIADVALNNAIPGEGATLGRTFPESQALLNLSLTGYIGFDFHRRGTFLLQLHFGEANHAIGVDTRSCPDIVVYNDRRNWTMPPG